MKIDGVERQQIKRRDSEEAHLRDQLALIICKLGAQLCWNHRQRKDVVSVYEPQVINSLLNF